MKRVLILANDFPPLNSPGAQRAYSFFKYLKRYGYFPIVVTRHWSADQVTTESKHSPSEECTVTVEENEYGRVYRVPFKGDLRDRLVTRFGLGRLVTLRKTLTVLIALAKFKFTFADNLNNLYREALKLCQETKMDVIIASGEPFILFKQAAMISKRLGIPWVADYRDGWSTNHLRAQSASFLQRLLLGYERRLEIKTLRPAACFVTVSQYLVERIGKLVGRPGFIIENGADLDYYRAVPVESDGVFRVVYTGTLHDMPYVDTVCAGVKRFLSEKYPDRFELLFVGIETSSARPLKKIQELARQYPNYIRVLPAVSPERAAKFQQEASVLLCLVAGSQAKGIMGAKLYSYAASRNPIISVLCEPIANTSFFPGRDIQRLTFTSEELSEAINYYYVRHTAGQSLKTSITDEELFSISREHQVEVLAGCLSCLDNSQLHSDVVPKGKAIAEPTFSTRGEFR